MVNNGKRLHFIEIHEESWCPLFIREATLIQLQGGWEFYKLCEIIGYGLSPAQTIGKIISDLFIKYNFECNVLLDLCTGASGPTHIVHDMLYKNNNKFISILSDLIPYNKEWELLSKKK
eukprot:218994_1